MLEEDVRPVDGRSGGRADVPGPEPYVEWPHVCGGNGSFCVLGRICPIHVPMTQGQSAHSSAPPGAASM